MCLSSVKVFIGYVKCVLGIDLSLPMMLHSLPHACFKAVIRTYNAMNFENVHVSQEFIKKVYSTERRSLLDTG